MGSIAAMENGSKDRYFQTRMPRNWFRKVWKAVWHIRDSVEDTVFQLMGGLRSGMGYCGAQDIVEL